MNIKKIFKTERIKAFKNKKKFFYNSLNFWSVSFITICHVIAFMIRPNRCISALICMHFIWRRHVCRQGGGSCLEHERIWNVHKLETRLLRSGYELWSAQRVLNSLWRLRRNRSLMSTPCVVILLWSCLQKSGMWFFCINTDFCIFRPLRDDPCDSCRSGFFFFWEREGVWLVTAWWLKSRKWP